MDSRRRMSPRTNANSKAFREGRERILGKILTPIGAKKTIAVVASKKVPRTRAIPTRKAFIRKRRPSRNRVMVFYFRT